MRPEKKRGFTVFFAMLVGGLALSIGLAIFELTVRELELSGTATQSQYAIYAADTGAECALYWDFKCDIGPCASTGSAFATSSASAMPLSGVTCNGIDIAATALAASPPTWPLAATASAATTTFTITFAPQPYCVQVTVEKSGNPSRTTVTSRGYNAACPPAASGVPRLERVLQVSY